MLAEVVASNTTAAISFENRRDAQQTLEALQAEPQIMAAWVYDKNGRLFARYSKEPAAERQLRRIRDYLLESPEREKISKGVPVAVFPLAIFSRETECS